MSIPLLRLKDVPRRSIAMSLALVLLALYLGGCARTQETIGHPNTRYLQQHLAASQIEADPDPSLATAAREGVLDIDFAPVVKAPDAAISSNEAPPAPAQTSRGSAWGFAATALEVLNSAVERMEQAARQQQSPPATPDAVSRQGPESQLARLALPAIALCTEVTRFGVYEPLPSAFATGRKHETVLYVEVDGFAAQQAADGTWETRMIFSAVLLDPLGKPVVEIPETEVIDRSRQRRRDFFLCTDFNLPATPRPGSLTLVVKLRDQLSDLTAEENLRLNMLEERAATLP